MFCDVAEAVREIQAGRMVVLIDDEDRENEGDLVMAAEHVTPEAINFMAKFGRGLICLPLTEERVDYLQLAPAAQKNTSRFGTAFTQPIEAREGVTTGISAADRAHTIRVAIDPASTAADLAQPGHVFPLRARKGGVLVRAGHTEASVDLARMAGLIPAGVICEILNEDGSMARLPDLERFCEEHALRMLTVAELIRYRLQHERHVFRVGETTMATAHGEFRMIAYGSETDPAESHVALVLGDLREGDSVPVRVHTHCLAGDVFGATTCDCREVIDGSLRLIAEAGRGALVYLHNGTRGFGLDRSVTPARVVLHRDPRGDARVPRVTEERSQRTLREIGLGGQILSDLGVHRIRLLTNTPTYVPALQGFGIEIVEQVAVPTMRSRGVARA